MAHSETDLGENVYWSTKTVTDGSVPVESWYAEIKDFNFKKMEPQKGTGHFTQVIWKGSRSVLTGWPECWTWGVDYGASFVSMKEEASQI